MISYNAMFSKITNLFKKIINRIARDTITFLTKRRPNRILLMQESPSGSNSYALWKINNSDIKKKFDLILAKEWELNQSGFFNFVEKHKLISSAQLIITTHASYKPSKKHLHLQLWHGALIKKNGIMIDGENHGMLTNKNSWRKSDYIMSYSDTYTTFVNACMVTSSSKYIVTGAPRNDFLYAADGQSNLSKIYGERILENKIIYFLPTFRDNTTKKNATKKLGNLFGFEKFSLQDFDKFLCNNKCQLIYKPHPEEEVMALNSISDYGLQNIAILNNNDLIENSIDLYELLSSCDILLTDYSSVFYDYLLLDRPIIFAPVDIEKYKKMRGFLLESFDDWTPGPKVYSQRDLQKEISRCLKDNNYYKDKRNLIKNLMHRFKDGESSYRMWSFIESIMMQKT